jgi:NAD(P)-dependent dehydrogenase (short-subunit alcohol dehydrogenase family)
MTRNVLITGARGAIGAATARTMAAKRWRVLATERAPSGEAVQLDVCDESSIQRAHEEVAAELGEEGLHGLVNNAGLSVDGPLELLTPDDLRHQLEVNVIGAHAVTRAFLPLLRRGGGRIVNVGGAAGRLPLPMFGALSASKAALGAMSDSLRMELIHQGVLVVYVEPGALESPFFEKSNAAARRRLSRAADSWPIYERAIAAAAKTMANTRTTSIDAAVGAITRALTARRPRARYVVGLDARVGLAVLRHLPSSVRDRVMLRSVGLTRSSFARTWPHGSGVVRRAH